MRRALVLVFGLCVMSAGCEKRREEERTARALGMQSDTVAVLVGAGDVADCSSPGSTATAALLDTIRGTVFIAGDVAYATKKNPNPLATCYSGTWGRHRARTRPVPGNHEYDKNYDPNAERYYSYFGDLAGPRGLGYYSYELGSWHVIALNTNISFATGSPQHAWLLADLDAHLGKCTIAYMHHPRFSSGPHDGRDLLTDLWRTFTQYGVSAVVAGHDHMYERFEPLDADGNPDAERGIRQFVVGTGGASSYKIKSIISGSEAISAGGFGLLKLSLLQDRYRWEFIPVAGNKFHDAGESACRPTHAPD